MSIATLKPPPAPAERSARRGPSRSSRIFHRIPLGKLSLSLPLLVLLIVLVLVPVGFVVYGAFQSAQPGDPTSTYTVKSMSRVYATTEFGESFLSTGVLALVVAALSTALGCVFAWLIARTNLPLRRSLEILLMSPIFLSPFIGAIAWDNLAAPNSGILNNIYRTIPGVGHKSHLFNITSVSGVVFVICLYYTPYAFLFVLSALRNMDPSLEEASYMNGAGKLRTALGVTFPLVRPAVAASFFFIAVLTTGIFTVPAVLATTGSFVPLAVRLQRAMNSYPTDSALGASLGTVMIVITVIGIFFYRRSIALAAKYVTVTGKGFRPRILTLGRTGKSVGLVACWLFVVLGVILPYAALILISLTPYAMTDLAHVKLTIKPITDVLTSPSLQSSLTNTLIVGVVVPTVAVVLGLAVAYSVNRARAPGRGAIDYLSTVPVAIPGIVLGTGLVWAYITTSIYATLTIIVLAFIAAYLPYAARLSSNALLQIDPSLEEASRINGAGRLRTVWRVTVPLSRSAILSAWIMIFIFATREISAAIVLAGPGNNLLSVMSWDYMNNGSMAQASIVGLIQTVLLLVAVSLSRLVFRVRLSNVAV